MSINKLLIRLLFFISIGCLEAQAQSGLSWTKKTITIDTDTSHTEQRFSFPFKNDGMETVVLLLTKGACRCIRLEPLKQTSFRSGEEGIIKGVVETNFLRGVQEKPIFVRTSLGDQLLTVRVAIKDLVVMDNDRVEWGIGDSPAKKHILLSRLSERFEVISVTSTSEVLHTETSEISGGTRLSIFPTTTSYAVRGFVKVVIKGESGRSQELRIPSLVR